MNSHLTPRQIVEKLDQYIIGQTKKRKRIMLRCEIAIDAVC